ncbi:MAG TPA: amino acid adenylation domain-containing protein [Streptosporangiaceae bacterium]|nr:amino acid adenylation domain-containing protein [Streptosporangiaceae bacterium]
MLTANQRDALAARLRQGRDGPSAAIPPRPAELRDLPLSFAQEQLWFLHRFAPGQSTYNVPQALSLSGPLDVAALEEALDALVARHEALRTRLVTGDRGDPIQVIDPPAPLPMKVTDLRDQPLAQMRQLAQAEAVKPFALVGGPLIRVRLYRLAEGDHVLLLVIHHVIFDGWSARVLLHDLAALYEQQITGGPSGLTQLPIQFADYALWERQRERGGPAHSELEQYWRQTLAEATTVHFPTDRPRPISDDGDGGLAEHLIDGELQDQLRDLSQRTGSTLFVILLSALQALLFRYTGLVDLTVGTVTANRARPELTPLIGFLVNTLPIRTDISGDPPFSELIERVRQATIGAYAHQDLPFAKIVAAARVPRDPSRAPLFQIALTYAERDETPVLAGGVRFALSDLIVGIPAAKFDLDFSIESRGHGLWIECSYKAALFDAGTIARLLVHLERLLRGAASNPKARLSELPLLTESELAREQSSWNPAPTPPSQGCVHEAFERQAAATPDATAIEFGAERISYAGLNLRADQLAHRLRTAGVGPDVLAAVSQQTGPRRLATLLAIWKAGGGYLPLDPALPADRLAFMIADANVQVVVTDEPSAASLPKTAATVINLDTEPIDQTEDRPARSRARPANIAYVIYTSGSTGQPKGVVVEHRQVLSFLTSVIDLFDIGPDDSVLQFSSLSFDASVQEMFMPLLAGGRVVLAPPDTLHSPRRLISLLSDHAVTVAVLTPSVISLLDDINLDGTGLGGKEPGGPNLGGTALPALRALVSGGEELPSDLAARWLRPGRLRFVNDYGPTETTVSAVCHELTARTPLPPPIGLPLPHCRAYLLDQHLNQVPIGVTAELHLGGTGVTRGYLNRPGLTAQRFIPDPFHPGGRLYRTGDLCFRRADGTIVFAGRADQQVKLRGLRIELGEIEAAIAAFAQVRQALVTTFTNQQGERLLVAYMSPHHGHHVDEPELRKHLSATLPSYMIPAHLITLTEFPLTVSGKVDRQALPAPANSAPANPALTQSERRVTQTEAVLTELFASLLNQPQLGPTDNFFTSGGTSLQAMRLVDLIATRLGPDLSPAAVFLHPTPRDLADNLGPSPSRTSNLTPLTVDLDRPPLVLIHAIGGTVFDYSKLAADLAGTFAVYGLQAPSLTQPDLAHPATVADLAAQYADLIRAGQPKGPYVVGGWSMGGVLAYEIGRRLESAGERVALLALLDPPYAVPLGTELSSAQRTAQFVADAAASLGHHEEGRPDPETTSPADQLNWLASTIDDANPELIAQLTRRYDLFAAHSRLLAGYQPEPATTIRAATVLVSASRSLNAPGTPCWLRHLSGPVHQVVLDSDHYEFLRPPLSAEVAAAITQWREAEHGERSASIDW